MSNPKNQDNEKIAGLLKYCIKHHHWSIFEQAFMTLEIETTRGLAAQILRHRSFTYQEFSQRYADSSMLANEIPLPELRRQDTKNRQNSIDDVDPTLFEYQILMQDHFKKGMELYKSMLDDDMQRMTRLLPLAVLQFLYMTELCEVMDPLYRFASQTAHRKSTWTLQSLHVVFSV